MIKLARRRTRARRVAAEARAAVGAADATKGENGHGLVTKVKEKKSVPGSASLKKFGEIFHPCRWYGFVRWFFNHPLSPFDASLSLCNSVRLFVVEEEAGRGVGR